MNKKFILIIGLLFLCSCENNNQNNKESNINSNVEEHSSESFYESSESQNLSIIDSSSQEEKEVVLPFI